jgi:hypothetical protein
MIMFWKGLCNGHNAIAIVFARLDIVLFQHRPQGEVEYVSVVELIV